MPEECTAEKKKKVAQVCVASTAPTQGISTVIDITSYSSLTKLLRVTAQVQRAVRRMQGQQLENFVSADDMEKAKAVWAQDIQREATQDPKYANWVREFGIYEDNSGVLRCRGRLQNAKLTFGQIHPVLLPANHPYTSLVVVRCHGIVGHNGVKETLTEVRSQHWIVRGRQVVRRLINQCTTCKRHEGPSYSTPEAQPLPQFRTTVDFPFTYTGVDFAGPLYVKDGNETRKA